MDNCCIFCGEIIPEGLQICDSCIHQHLGIPMNEDKTGYYVDINSFPSIFEGA